jgi:hypothetical protein
LPIVAPFSSNNTLITDYHSEQLKVVKNQFPINILVLMLKLSESSAVETLRPMGALRRRRSAASSTSCSALRRETGGDRVSGAGVH